MPAYQPAEVKEPRKLAAELDAIERRIVAREWEVIVNPNMSLARRRAAAARVMDFSRRQGAVRSARVAVAVAEGLSNG
jgi:hypothetical protein